METYEVIGRTCIGTYAVIVKAKNVEEAIKKAMPRLRSLAFGNYRLQTVWAILA